GAAPPRTPRAPTPSSRPGCRRAAAGRGRGSLPDGWPCSTVSPPRGGGVSARGANSAPLCRPSRRADGPGVVWCVVLGEPCVVSDDWCSVRACVSGAAPCDAAALLLRVL